MSTHDLPAEPAPSEVEILRRPRPQAPIQPDPEDCCRSGCVPCVFDLYEEALVRYERELAAWEAAQAALPPPSS